jgi:hypothetical protein
MVLETILAIPEPIYWRVLAIFVGCIIAMAKVGFWRPITPVLGVKKNMSVVAGRFRLRQLITSRKSAG